MATLCTITALWRLAVRFQINIWLGFCDWLMLAGVVLNFLSCVPYAVLAAKSGQGRLMQDPWWLEPGRTSNELRYIFITQCLNVYAMFLVKSSICAYLMNLGFGRGYRGFIWVSIVVVVACNFIMMLILHFASCRPFYSRWDDSIDGKCWPEVVGKTLIYVDIASNIFTNLIFAAAPVVYLRRVQLSKQAEWGARIIFLFALVEIGLSIAKIPMTMKFLHSDESIWDAVDLSICSINEVCVGIIIANLPPLRRTILGFFSKLIPESYSTSLGKHTSQYTASRGSQHTSKSHAERETIADNESECCILELNKRPQSSGIMKTTHVMIQNGAAHSNEVHTVKEHV
ncbi:hypothetical protein PTMSG1_02070 [Pyrenophora teres f. maculata]|nr:hypothetical protein PTMSG1_02070 [Pyrenophora teres f. maculata]